jgi:hypothetical protein
MFSHILRFAPMFVPELGYVILDRKEHMLVRNPKHFDQTLRFPGIGALDYCQGECDRMNATERLTA